MSQFQFLAIEWADIASAAMRAEAQVHSDPRAACFNSRRALELGIHWLYRNDNRLKLPYQHHLSALIHEPTFVSVITRTLAPRQPWIARSAGAVHNAVRAVLDWHSAQFSLEPSVPRSGPSCRVKSAFASARPMAQVSHLRPGY